MGAWGVEPWENDSAADWFGDTFEQTRLAEQVERALLLDVENDYEEIRAAAYLVRLLARTYIWPVNDIDRHRALAAERLQAILAAGIFEDADEFVQAITAEIAELRADAP